MILLLTDGAPKPKGAEDKTLHTITKEFALFKHEYSATNLKLLALLFGKDKNSVQFIEKLTQETVKT